MLEIDLDLFLAISQIAGQINLTLSLAWWSPANVECWMLWIMNLVIPKY